MSTGTSVTKVTRTNGLTGVTKGSPWLGRSNGVARETHGIQRYRAEMPLTRGKSQLDPGVAERRDARKPTRTVVVAPARSTPRSGTRIVWSSRVACAGEPSTVTE